MPPSDSSAPPPFEQRLVDRVLRHWAEMATAQRFPRLTEIDPWMLGNDWANCALIRLGAAPADATFITVGDELIPGGGQALADKPLASCPAGTVLALTLSHLPRALTAGSPVTVEGAGTDARGTTMLYRSVLLPLSDDSVSIHYVLVAANHRVQRQGEHIAPFGRETVIAREA